MKVAYFSPFNPIKSGISDFSEELVVNLVKHMDVDLFVDCQRVTNREIASRFKIFPIESIYQEDIRKQYDFLLYHVGNHAGAHSKIVKTFFDFPGICELHDVSLHNFVAEDTLVKWKWDEYIRIMEYCHGDEGKRRAIRFLEGQCPPPWEANSMKYTVNKHIIDNATAVIVHSDFAKQMVQGIRPEVPIVKIPLHTSDIIEDPALYKQECRKKLNIDLDDIVMGSFGFASAPKRIIQIIMALKIYKKKNNTKKFKFYIVGEVKGIDVEGACKELGLENEVVVTGYTDLEMFKKYMGACDFCFNLRYPTQGETSASLHRMLGMGKPVVVTDNGTFREYPDEFVIKVGYGETEIEEICEAIENLTVHCDLLQKGKHAVIYSMQNYDLPLNAKRYKRFFEQLKTGTYRKEYADLLVDRFMLFHYNEDYIKSLMKKLDYMNLP